MKMLMRALCSSIAILVFVVTANTIVHAQKRMEDRFANVNGVRLHYLIAGKGDPVILMPRRRKGLGKLFDRARALGRYGCAGSRHQRLGTLADGRSTGSGHSAAHSLHH
jgi:hypothetical protein